MKHEAAQSGWPGATPPPGLFVTGTPRSGTTWVGRMLALGRHFFYVHEPFKDRIRKRYPEIYGSPFMRYFPYVSREADGANIAPFMDWIIRGGEPAHWSGQDRSNWSHEQQNHLHEIEQARSAKIAPLIKDPLGVLAIEWMLARYDLPVLAMARHPAEFVRSILSHGWHTRPGFFLRQKHFMATLPQDLADEIRALYSSQDKLRQAALMWKVMNFHINRLAEAEPSRVHVVRHEDLASDPQTGFAELLTVLGMRDEHHLQEIDYWCSDSNPVQPKALWVIKRNSRGNYDRWRNWFSGPEIAVIREMTEPLARKFGYSFD